MIRRANEKDIPAIMDLLTQVLGVHHEGRPDIFKEEGQKYTEEELKSIIEDDMTPVFVYVEENQPQEASMSHPRENPKEKVLGHCFLQIQDHPELPHMYAYKTLYIDDLVVDEDARGKGIGKKLYYFVKDYAKANGFFNVTLHAWECNPNAVAFYRSLGMGVQSYTFEEVIR